MRFLVNVYLSGTVHKKESVVTRCTLPVLAGVIYSVCSMEELNRLIQINPNLYKMCGDCAVC